jgi:hypothetical protein
VTFAGLKVTAFSRRFKKARKVRRGPHEARFL